MKKSPIIKRSRPVAKLKDTKELAGLLDNKQFSLPGCICGWYQQDLACTAHDETRDQVVALDEGQGPGQAAVDGVEEGDHGGGVHHLQPYLVHDVCKKDDHNEIDSDTQIPPTPDRGRKRRSILKRKKIQEQNGELSQSLLALHKELYPEVQKEEMASQSLLKLHKDQYPEKEGVQAKEKNKMVDGMFSWNLSLELDNI